jgi:molecular chaperone DnaJ
MGGEIVVPTLHGEASINVPAGTQNHRVFTLRGKGMPTSTNGRSFGDQHVRVEVEVPKKLTARQKELLEEFAAESGQVLRKGEKGFFQKLRETFEV